MRRGRASAAATSLSPRSCRSIPRASKPEGSYARDALKTGLALGASLGVNPYDFGMIGSSDTHNSAPPIEEDNYHGKLTQLDGTAAMRAGRVARSAEARAAGRETAYSAAGLAAVWADANTREAIYDALRRKETFATSGTRISLRFFGGWEFAPALVQAPDFVAQAYASGVPMGSHPASRCWQRRIPTARISTGCRSSRAGWMPRAGRRRRSSTSPGPASVSSMPRAASCARPLPAARRR